jgi:hypothetical protein
MTDNEADNAPVCMVCGTRMCRGEVAIRLNPFCIKQFEGWFCPNHENVRALNKV